jgi:hypothetical protein
MACSRFAASRSPQQPAAYSNAAVRGQLRQWKEKLAQQYRQFDRAYCDARTHSFVQDFVKRSSREGRRRALRKLARAFGPGITPEGLRLDGNHPMAVWSILRPRESVAACAPAESGLAQDCVTVDFLLAGWLPSLAEGGLADGLWSLEIPDHALGRAIERSGGLPDAIIAEAHHNVLRLRQDQLKQPELTVLPVAASDGFRMTLGSQFLVRAGGGGFVCELTLGPNVEADDDPRVPFSELPGRELGVQVRAATWIAEDMVNERQVLLAGDGMPGERLGDGWLLPQPLRQLSLVKSANGGMSLNLARLEPGLPELTSYGRDSP